MFKISQIKLNTLMEGLKIMHLLDVTFRSMPSTLLDAFGIASIIKFHR